MPGVSIAQQTEWHSVTDSLTACLHAQDRQSYSLLALTTLTQTYLPDCPMDRPPGL